MRLLPGKVIFIVALLSLSSFVHAANIVEGSRSDVSLRHELENSIGRGLTWLAGQQQAEGWWSQQEHPALTALVLTAYQGDPSGFYKRKYNEHISKGYAYVLGKVNADGGIYEKALAEKAMANYNTSVAIMALLSSHRPEYEDIIRNARNFLMGLQYDEGKHGMGDSALDGGIGYGGTYRHSDLSNTMFALEAIYYTKYLKGDSRKNADEKDLNWDAVIQFVSRTQNLPGYNDQKWASDDPDNKGGFVYFPGDSKAGEVQLPDGRVALRSYGSMSYAGLLSYIYAQMDREDPRIRAVLEWLTRHYTLEENPGMGQQGLYYYYHTMAKSLSIAGIDTLKLEDGRVIHWRQELAKRLLDLQKQDGSWVNENGRWWERDPVLVTSYALIVLEIISRGL